MLNPCKKQRTYSNAASQRIWAAVSTQLTQLREAGREYKGDEKENFDDTVEANVCYLNALGDVYDRSSRRYVPESGHVFKLLNTSRLPLVLRDAIEARGAHQECKGVDVIMRSLLQQDLLSHTVLSYLDDYTLMLATEELDYDGIPAFYCAVAKKFMRRGIAINGCALGAKRLADVYHSIVPDMWLEIWYQSMTSTIEDGLRSKFNLVDGFHWDKIRPSFAVQDKLAFKKPQQLRLEVFRACPFVKPDMERMLWHVFDRVFETVTANCRNGLITEQFFNNVWDTIARAVNGAADGARCWRMDIFEYSQTWWGKQPTWGSLLQSRLITLAHNLDQGVSFFMI